MTPQEYLDWCRDMSERLKKYEYHFTNADRIRSMTDEELSSWINDHADCTCRCEAWKNGCMDSDSTCMAAWLEWLKEKVKDE